jgi:hypothetical protein
LFSLAAQIRVPFRVRFVVLQVADAERLNFFPCDVVLIAG